MLLILFAAGLVAHGIHEFNEAGIVPAVVDPVWDINWFFSETSIPGEMMKALFGYNGNPSLTEVVAYLVYFLVLFLDVRQLQRVCVRAGAGLARLGSHYGHGSGDFVVAFSTANRIEHDPVELITTRSILADEAKVIDGLFRAVVESVEEAIVNSLFGAETVVGRDEHVAWALPADEVLKLTQRR